MIRSGVPMRNGFHQLETIRRMHGLRCEDGRVMRHDPQPDDPYLETDIGRCPDCGGRGCDAREGE